jgi:hypothetical protein
MGSELLAQCQGYTCLQILNAIFAFTPIYFIFLIFGVFSVLLFSSQMMRQPTYLSSESNDPIGLFPPQYLTFRAKYRLASVSYAALLVLTYLVFTLIMDQPGIDLPQLGSVKATPTPAKELMVDGVRWQIKYLDPTVPLLLALVLIGVLPRFALIESYEKRLREWIHEIFLIPTLGRITADRIENAPVDRVENAPIDFMARLAPRLTRAEAEGAGPLVPPRTYETLVRLSIITGVPETLKAVPSTARFFDSAHLAAYRPRFAAAETLADSFCSNVKAATALVSGIASPAAGVAMLTDRLKAEHQALKGELRFLSLVLAGAILRRTGSEDQVNRALAAVGLQASPSNVESTAGDTAIYVSIWVAMAFWVWSVVVDGAFALSQPDVIASVAEQIIGATIDGVVTFFVYAAVLLTAMAYRRRRREASDWSDYGELGFGRPTNYFKLALIALATGFFVTFAWRALLFGVISVPTTGPNWLHIASLSMAESLRPPVVAVLIALLADRKEALSDRKGSLVLILAGCAFFMFLSGFVVGDVIEATLANVSAATGGSERVVVSHEQWVSAFQDGLVGLWIILVLMFALLPQLRQACVTAFSRTLLRLNGSKRA